MNLIDNYHIVVTLPTENMDKSASFNMKISIVVSSILIASAVAIPQDLLPDSNSLLPDAADLADITSLVPGELGELGATLKFVLLVVRMYCS